MELKHITTLFLSNDGQVPACCGYLPRGGASPFRAYALSPSGRYLFGRCTARMTATLPCGWKKSGTAVPTGFMWGTAPTRSPSACSAAPSGWRNTDS